MTHLTFSYQNCTYYIVQYHVDAFCILCEIATQQHFRCGWDSFTQICPSSILCQCMPSASPVWGPGCGPDPIQSSASCVPTSSTPACAPSLTQCLAPVTGSGCSAGACSTTAGSCTPDCSFVTLDGNIKTCEGTVSAGSLKMRSGSICDTCLRVNAECDLTLQSSGGDVNVLTNTDGNHRVRVCASDDIELQAKKDVQLVAQAKAVVQGGEGVFLNGNTHVCNNLAVCGDTCLNCRTTMSGITTVNDQFQVCGGDIQLAAHEDTCADCGTCSNPSCSQANAEGSVVITADHEVRIDACKDTYINAQDTLHLGAGPTAAAAAAGDSVPNRIQLGSSATPSTTDLVSRVWW